MTVSVQLHPELRKWVEERLSRYPTRRSLLVPTLIQAQKYHDYASPGLMQAVADLLQMPASEVMSVASFYTLIAKHPVGKHIIQVCHNVSCYLRGCDEVIARLEERLGCKVGETTEDGKFTLITVECLAACGSAPVMMVDEKLYENVRPDQIGRILAEAN
ncbi:NADH-quinone oxidoreductase subunit NuoE [bacterium]|nr:NADH-quinone oxidoreductase subunit NuoE [bacterium]